jgi:hypothetical protein
MNGVVVLSLLVGIVLLAVLVMALVKTTALLGVTSKDSRSRPRAVAESSQAC